MTKKRILGILLASALIILGALSFLVPNDITSHEEKMTVTDSASRAVEIPISTRPIVALDSVMDQEIDRLSPGRHKCIIKTNIVRYGDLLSDNEKARFTSLPICNQFDQPSSTELIMNLNPAAIITVDRDPNMNNREAEFGGIPIVIIDKDSFSGIARSWAIMGQVAGNEELGNKISNYLFSEMATFDSLSKTIEHKKKFWIAKDVSTAKTVGPESMMNDAIHFAGGVSYWDSHAFPEKLNPQSDAKLPIEALIDYDPDIIFCNHVSQVTEILNDERLQNLTAVKNKQVFTEKKYRRLQGFSSFPSVVYMMELAYPGLYPISAKQYASKYYELISGNKIQVDDPRWDVDN